MACGFEIAAITTGRIPTITALCARHRWLGPAVLLTLAVHLYRVPKVLADDGDCPLCP